MSFDYGHTCPDIDREISSAKDLIESHIDSITEELSPLFFEKGSDQWRQEARDSLYDDLEGCFESVRKTNEDMRSEAEKQMQGKDDEIDDMKDEISSMKELIEEKDEEIATLLNQ